MSHDGAGATGGIAWSRFGCPRCGGIPSRFAGARVSTLTGRVTWVAVCPAGHRWEVAADVPKHESYNVPHAGGPTRYP